jgi:hypothetical protein
VKERKVKERTKHGESKKVGKMREKERKRQKREKSKREKKKGRKRKEKQEDGSTERDKETERDKSKMARFVFQRGPSRISDTAGITPTMGDLSVSHDLFIGSRSHRPW